MRGHKLERDEESKKSHPDLRASSILACISILNASANGTGSGLLSRQSRFESSCVRHSRSSHRRHFGESKPERPGRGRRLLSGRLRKLCKSCSRLSANAMRAWRNSNVSGFQPEVPRAALGARTKKAPFVYWLGSRSFKAQETDRNRQGAPIIPLRLTAGWRALNASVVVRIHEGEPNRPGVAQWRERRSHEARRPQFDSALRDQCRLSSVAEREVVDLRPAGVRSSQPVPICGCSSTVECRSPKPCGQGSNPCTRANCFWTFALAERLANSE
jgi:hypothetical protein